MYTDDDLDLAVQQDIFVDADVKKFRSYMAKIRNVSSADEENFRLVSGFNDIFVVIASVLLLVSSAWVGRAVHPAFAMFLVAALSWGLAEFFVLKRKMALPAIVLLLAFSGSIFSRVSELYDLLLPQARPYQEMSSQSYMLGALFAALSTWLHWKRFKVPITVAIGAGSGIAFFIFTVLSVYPDAIDWVLLLMAISGLVAFSVAMRWDVADRSRTTYKSDVAFWLHLLSAPLMIHPVFSVLGVFDGAESTLNTIVVVLLYLVMTSVSVVIDRRALMVSSLVYVLYALSALLKTYGMISYSLAAAGVFIGFALLMLSGFWHGMRAYLLGALPAGIQSRVPETQ